MTEPSLLVDELAALLTQVEATPKNVDLLYKQLHLTTQLQMSAEIRDTILRLSSLVMLDESIWLSYLDGMIQAVDQPITLEAFVDILERFDQAEHDYLSSAILLRHIQFILDCVASKSGSTIAEEPTLTVDEDVTTFLTEATVREMLRGTIARGVGLLSEIHLLWGPWVDWELSIGDPERIHEIYVEMISVPHSTMDTTSSAYSSYCSEHCPQEYESRMVKLTEASHKAKHKWSGEKRSGKTREDMELLVAENPLENLSRFIEWETDPRAKNPRNDRSPTTDTTLTRAVFERTVTAYSKTAAAARAASCEADSEVRVQGDQTALAYKKAEAAIWEHYAVWTQDDSIRQRAVRACPEIGSSWRNLMNQQELAGEAVEDSFQTALELSLIHQPSDLAEIFICRAASLHRQDRNDPQPVLNIVNKGFQTILKTQPIGDLSFRLEKYLLDWAENVHPNILDSALELAARPSKSRSSAYQMILLRTGIETRRGNVTAARMAFVASIQRTDLDWPEAIYEAFLQFETVHGDLESLASAYLMIETELQKLTRRRNKAAQEQFQDQYLVSVQAAASTDTPTIASPNLAAGPSGGTAAPAANEDTHFKRDREHTTILVTGLSPSTGRVQIESYFSEFGHIREITMLNGESAAALVEFRFADAVPGALTRDRKQLDGSQLHVSMLWRSTLFVTNFPRDLDDEGIRRLFSQYGTILQTRWPSRKYSDSRRFCYITMNSPASAQECLLLHGMQLEGLSLTVLISDPAARTRRTDFSDSANHTLFVGGLSTKTTENDVEALLSKHGTVAGIKLGWDPVKRVCRGFAFVEMSSETEAKAACDALHGTQRNGKFLKVEFSDPNHAAKKSDSTTTAGALKAAEKRLRTLRLHNLPEGTQEGLLQQALEKIVPVKRLEIFGKAQEALVELNSQSDAGLLLLRPEPFIFNETTITFSEPGRKPVSDASTSLSFAPRAARRGKAIPKPRPQGARSVATNNNQDFFRNIVEAKNTERSENKRKAGEQAETTSKRARGDQSVKH